MKKALLALMCLAAMIAASTSLKAQEVTIVLDPGWTWMSCPTTEAMNFAAALGDFTPMQGNLENVCSKLIEQALKGGSSDNITVTIGRAEPATEL